MITRVLLVIALLGCLAHAQYGSNGKCVCRRTRERFGNPKAIQDIQIYPPSHTCDKMEIIVFQKNGMQYCLDPKVKKVQELMRHLQSKRGQ
ncbi:C-X-C motif chemokine 9-like isoform X1 [Anguilla rostrata]|uniref:C-X-C motif chemokine 9-like isoform X1 n=1 Tax=Anguilla rostrata TaxID=7938 RepID=UPI0030CD09D1